MDEVFTIWSYIFYLVISIAVTIYVAYTLHKNGRIFLVDAFHGNEPLADSVNHLLVVGFYLINIGFVALALKYGTKPSTVAQSFEFCSTKVGLVLIILGVMHFFNLYVFSRLRRSALIASEPPPVAPNMVLDS
jgi:hypothetical protein